MIVFLCVAIVFCTLYLVTHRVEKVNGWQIAWIAVCLGWAGAACGMNTGEWNYSETTQWMIRGPITRGPGFHLVAYFAAQAAILLVLSYLAGRILNAILRTFIARGRRTPLPNGEKRKPDLPFCPTCYCCNERKSFWHDYPSKICGERICFDCLKALNFDSLSTELHLAAFGGLPPFNTADDVIAMLKRRQGDGEFEERRRKVLAEKALAEKAAPPKPPRTGLHILQLIGSVYCLLAAAALLAGSLIGMKSKAQAQVLPGRVAIVIGLFAVLVILGILGIRGYAKWKREQAAQKAARDRQER